jgi:predicted heme/steroid binding protein
VRLRVRSAAADDGADVRLFEGDLLTLSAPRFEPNTPLQNLRAAIWRRIVGLDGTSGSSMTATKSRAGAAGAGAGAGAGAATGRGTLGGTLGGTPGGASTSSSSSTTSSSSPPDVVLRLDPTSMAHPAPRRDESLVMPVPAARLPPEARRVGSTVQLRGGDGEVRLATVTALALDVATLDMNDPLAGRALVLRITVEAFLAGDAAARAAVADALQFGPGSLLRRALPDPAAVPGRVFGAEELRAYDGNHARTEGKVYLAVCGLVYDMSAGAKYYGPGGPYGTLAGHDATLCLAKHSLAPALRDAPWSAEQGAAAPLSPEEEGTLANFLKTFAKYPIVGRLALCAGGSTIRAFEY